MSDREVTNRLPENGEVDLRQRMVIYEEEHYQEAIRWARLWYPLILIGNLVWTLALWGLTLYIAYKFMWQQKAQLALAMLITMGLFFSVWLAILWSINFKKALMAWNCPKKYYRDYCLKR